MIYLIHFLDDWLDFRYAEFFSLLRYHGHAPEDVVLCSRNAGPEEFQTLKAFAHLPLEEMQAYWQRKRLLSKADHFMLVEMPSDEAIRAVCARAVLVKGVYQLWAVAPTFEQNVEAVRSIDSSAIAEQLHSLASWSVQVLTFGRTFTMAQKAALRQQYDFLAFSGPVDLRAPEREYWLLVDYSPDIHADISSSPPFLTFFGRKVGGSAMKATLQKYDLKKRLYLGPTSLDDSLAFILANLALVGPSMLVLEPFVGTGSIALALAHWQAFVFGADIDPRVLRGDMYAGSDTIAEEDDKRDVRANFTAYGLPLPELVRMDAHLLDRHLGSGAAGLFQAIVTDPPYGIRAGAKKSGKKGSCDYTLSEEQRVDHVPSTQAYAVEEVMLDLLHNAARCLALGGRLVYLIPTTYDFTLADLPTHPCLLIEEVCHQPLSARHGRRAVVMRKHTAHTAQQHEQFLAYKQRILRGGAADGEEGAGFSKLMPKLQAALAAGAHDNDAVVKVVSNCGERRRLSREHRKQLREAGLAHPSKPNSTRRMNKKQLAAFKAQQQQQAEQKEEGEEEVQEVEGQGGDCGR